MARSATGPKKRPVELLTSAEVAALLRECSTLAPTGIRNRALITIMYRGGLRVEEALDLRAAHINPRNGTVQILHGKGDKARIVSIDDGAMALVQRWMDARDRLVPGHGPLFCTLHGTKLSDSYVRNMMRRIGNKAGRPASTNASTRTRCGTPTLPSSPPKASPSMSSRPSSATRCWPPPTPTCGTSPRPT